MSSSRIAIVALSLSLVAPDVLAQDSKNPGRVGRRALLDRTEEVALARSAAPASVSDSATIWVFTDTGYVLAVKGSSGAACYVSRSWPTSIEPHCFDAEGAATIMPIHMHEVELLHRGTSIEDVDRAVGAGLVNGTFRLPRRPVMSYMMSAGQKLVSDAGQPVGSWRPHVMVYYPYLESSDFFPGASDVAAGMITGSGSPTSSLMFLAPEFVKVRSPGP